MGLIGLDFGVFIRREPETSFSQNFRQDSRFCGPSERVGMVVVDDRGSFHRVPLPFELASREAL